MRTALMEWGIASKLSNMSLERLLAQVKAASPSRSPLAERLVASGFLTQLLAEHLRLGGRDPRYDNVKQMVGEGAPLNVADKPRSNTRMVRPSCLYANAQLSAEKAKREIQGGARSVMTAAERNRVLKRAGQEFASLLPEHQLPYNAKARRLHYARSSDACDDHAVPTRATEEGLRGRFFGKGSLDFPISVQATQDAVWHVTGQSPPASGVLPGFTGLSSVARDRFRRNMVIANEGDIPESAKFDYRNTCWKRHNGLCPRQDGPLFRSRRALGSGLWRAAVADTWYKLHSQLEGLDDGPAFFVYCAFRRGMDPQIAVFARVDAEADETTLALGERGGSFDFHTEAQVSRLVIRNGSGDTAETRVARVWLSKVNVQVVPGDLLRARVVDLQEPVQVFASAARYREKADTPHGCCEASAATALDTRMAMFEAAVLGERSRGARGGARGVGGQPPRAASEDDGTHAGMRDEDEGQQEEEQEEEEEEQQIYSDSDGGDFIDVPVYPDATGLREPQPTASGAASADARALRAPSAPELVATSPPPPPPPLAPAGSQAARRPRQRRAEHWGEHLGAPFYISKIVANGKCTGYGAVCSLHKDADDEQKSCCKKTLSFGAGQDALSVETVIVHLKRWLLHGLDIPTSSVQPRLEHRGVDARFQCSVGVAPEELDTELERKFGEWQRARNLTGPRAVVARNMLLLVAWLLLVVLTVF